MTAIATSESVLSLTPAVLWFVSAMQCAIAEEGYT